MLFKELNKDEVVKHAQMLFLKTFPLQEIDCPKVKSVCKDYRTMPQPIGHFLCLLDSHFDYFYDWAYKNWMIDVFYNRKR